MYSQYYTKKQTSIISGTYILVHGDYGYKMCNTSNCLLSSYPRRNTGDDNPYLYIMYKSSFRFLIEEHDIFLLYVGNHIST
jgi:hypothetical protein